MKIARHYQFKTKIAKIASYNVSKIIIIFHNYIET